MTAQTEKRVRREETLELITDGRSQDETQGQVLGPGPRRLGVIHLDYLLVNGGGPAN